MKAKRFAQISFKLQTRELLTLFSFKTRICDPKQIDKTKDGDVEYILTTIKNHTNLGFDPTIQAQSVPEFSFLLKVWSWVTTKGL